jgi:creatinine amidohydrolase
MNPNTGGNPVDVHVKTLWSELLPYEFKQRLAECPVVYLPLGLCEPHGQVSAFGLDTIKAEWLCQQAAGQVGGIVAPSMGYPISMKRDIMRDGWKRQLAKRIHI